MAFPAWMYRDPMKAKMASERYVSGCFNCIRNKYNKRTKQYSCILNHKIWPDGDDFTCQDRKGKR